MKPMSKSVKRARAALLKAMRQRVPGAPHAMTLGAQPRPATPASASDGGGGARSANARVYLTGETCADRTMPTRDPADKAHQVRNAATGMLQPGSFVPGTPRRYPACAMTSQGVSYDSAFDELHEMQRRLACIPGLGGRGSSVSDVGERLGPAALRRLVRE